MFYSNAGKFALGSRLKFIADTLLADAAKVYALYDVNLDTKWFPVFYALTQQEEMSVTAIAQAIGHSHPSVSKIVKEMQKADMVETQKSAADSRVNVVRLSAKGQALIPKAEVQFADVQATVDSLLKATGVDLWQALDFLEAELAEKPLYARVVEQKQARETEDVIIRDYTPVDQTAFKAINIAWISVHWDIEASDHKTFEHPEQYIIQPGGHILLAECHGQVVGSCALIPMEDETCFELAKMCVVPDMKGKRLGWRLGQAAIQRAREVGKSTLYLESNAVLKPAIQLYRKLGFTPVLGQASPYARCNIQMQMTL